MSRTLRNLSQQPAVALRSVGPRKAAALTAMGIETVLDLLLHYPRRYVDRSHLLPIAQAPFEEEVLVSGTVTSVSSRRPRRGGRPIVHVSISDDSGSLACTFFNQPWRARQLGQGTEVAAFGKIERFGGRRSMANPVVDVIGAPGAPRQTGKVIAIYPQSAKAGIGSAELSKYMEEVIERAGEFADPLPAHWREQLSLTARTAALRSIHAPETVGDNIPARRRLAFDELLRLQLELVRRKRAAEAGSKGIEHAVADGAGRVPGLVAAFLASLPFDLTAAQRKAITEIASDMGRPYPMHRLLQGDVGAGKTVVALAALLYAVQGGYQGAFMVPTEVLAEQHFLVARRVLSGLEVPDPGRLGGTRQLEVALLTSRTPAAERARLLAALAAGEIEVLVGTHALLTEEVRFAALGTVVVDEQHRFGVEQRSALREKAGADPDLLVMTATPIPRTAAMTVYGDLELTTLDELPPGRTPVKTVWLEGAAAERKAWERVRAEVEAGRRTYVVCPLVSGESGADDGAVDAGELSDAEEDPYDEGLVATGAMFRPSASEVPRRPPRAVTEEIGRLTEPGGVLEGVAVGLLHGQLPSSRKDEVMDAFRRGELKVLVATTVIEVGVDVPEATVMVVEDADRFGIAQLHQLRGRVGRGRDKSWCYLLTSDAPGDDAVTRLRALEASTDGFELAETDLDLRGEGSVLGTRQKGRNGLRLASIRHNRDLVQAAREVATAIVDEDPDLSRHDLLADEVRLFIPAEEGDFLLKS